MIKQLRLAIKLTSNIFGNDKLVRKFFYDVQKLIDNNGVPFTIRYMKCVKLHITRYISGKPLKSNSSLVSIDSDYFPNRFLYLKDLVDSKANNDKRLVLTLLSYTRAIKPKSIKDLPEPNYSTITDPYKGKEYTIPKAFIKKWVEDNYLKSNNPIWGNNLHYISNKSSPFGKATASALFGLFYFINCSHKILSNWLGLIGEQYYKILIEPSIRMVFKDHRTFISSDKMSEGKLSIVKDPELKMRVIAMVDYYSQFLLKPIHDNILNKLGTLKCDRTFTQSPFHDWGKTMGNNFWSLDLSAATDRFPISLQEKLLTFIYDENLAKYWKAVLVDRYYKTPDNRDIKYSVGQPMGAYSSWAVFTITHHLVVAWCAHICGYEKFDKYIILGDDIVINNDKVARKYIQVMTWLGVDISEQKTHVSKNTYEFAKRWIHKGHEISGLPLRGITNNMNNPTTIITNIVEYLYKVNPLCKLSTKEILYRTLSNIKIGKRFYPKSKIKYLVDSTLLVIRYNKKTVTYQELREYFSKYITISELIIPKEDEICLFMNRVLSIGLMKLAEKNANSLYKYKETFQNSMNYPDSILLKNNPVVHGLYNKLLLIRDSVRTIRNKSEFDLIDILDDLRIDQPDKLLDPIRNPSKSITYFDKLWRSSIRSINLINDINYNNFNIDHRFASMKPFETFFESNLSNELDQLDQLRSGYQMSFW
ncbi:RNA-dependent RNA polymerase [Colletotrichum falcatum mitovirus 1]|nr:RNA-dependent RNA polymerase [Colletotrichum falcatum mitovirus 1]